MNPDLTPIESGHAIRERYDRLFQSWLNGPINDNGWKYPLREAHTYALRVIAGELPEVDK